MTQGKKAAQGAARVVRADRTQLSWDLVDPEGWLPADHRARLVWAFVQKLDLTRLYDAIQSREGTAGRPAADPAVLLALWLLATIEGIGSARELDRLTSRDLAYRWLSNGVPVNHHGLADFRVGHAEILDELLTQSLAALTRAGLVDLDEIIVDGTKVRASAGGGSFKEAAGLDGAVAAAKARVETLKAELDADPAASSRRRVAARARAERQIAAQAAKAKETLAKIEAERQKRAKRSPKEVAAKKEPRASLSDAEARRMRFADGAIRAAYNVQLAVTSDHGFITAVKVTDRRNDSGLVRPMLEATERRLGHRVKRVLADSGYACVEDIALLSARADAPQLLIHPPEEKMPTTPKQQAARARKRAAQPEAVKVWREKMATEAAKTVMKRRSRIERVNAQLKNRGFGTMLVRGIDKVQAVGWLHALAHNMATAMGLRASAGIAAA